MLLIVGAEGYLGNKIIQNVLQHQHSHRFCLLTSDQAQHQIWQQQALQSYFIAPQQHEQRYALLKQCHALCLISKAYSDTSIQQEKHLIDLAAQAGIEHIFYSSLALKQDDLFKDDTSLHSQYSVQQYLQQTEISHSLIQRSMCVETIPSFVGHDVLEQGVVVAAGHGKVPFVSCEEVAKAIAKIVTEPVKTQRHYHLTGRRAYSYGDIAKILSHLAQRTVHYIDADRAIYRQKLIDLQLSATEIAQRLATLADIKAHRYEIESDDLSHLIGKRQMMISDYLQRCYAL